MRIIAGLVLAALALTLPPAAPAADGYQLPPPALQAIVDAPRAPSLDLSPRRDLAAMLRAPGLPGIAMVAQPELKLAGVRINPRTYARSRFFYTDDLWLIETASGRELRFTGLPAPLQLADLHWSPDQSHLAFTHLDAASGELQLWVADTATRRARRLAVPALNAVYGSGFTWMPDSQRLLLRTRPADQGPAPVSDGIPSGPNIQVTDPAVGERQIRTYQDLLRNEHDAATFEHYATSQLLLTDLAGVTRTLGEPALYISATPSPDGRLILTERMARPFSYIVPAWFFPRHTEVLDLDGALIHSVAELPLVEGLPKGNDAERDGIRIADWRADAPATLYLVQALDGGDPSREVEFRDQVSLHAAPFDGEPTVLARLTKRFNSIEWGTGEVALLTEAWWKDRSYNRWSLAPDMPTLAPVKLHGGSYEDRYAYPGDPVLAPDAAGNARILFTPDGESIYFMGDGASPEGDRPFLDRLHLADQQVTRLFRSAAPYYEQPVEIMDPEAKRLLTLRESPKDPPNFQMREAGRGGVYGKPKALTRFPHPTPQLKDIRKEQIRYTRADGVELTGTLYLPAGYDAKRDGRLPFLLWAYPQEFKSAAAASQVTDSPYRFNRVSYWGPLPFLAMGYGVLDDPSMPIVGEGDAEPNDTYVPQLVASAQAAVDELVRRGVADRERIAIGGHSYGAFMAANLLAHSRLFRTAIARSGAYNRTLTPFGFQAEERNYWAAKDTYLEMSPFHHAEKIKDPVLFIHGEQDNNSGTFPIQSERLFAAIKGMGGTARLVMLPNESHGYRARESILHMLAETHAWLEQHVKPPKPAAQ